ncbi:glycosyltransferase family 4 protein [Brevibacillus fluminis]|uniref:glycosyltransferase family 4 protein n=1 Tax=Brevibacillus fluminis TaxID=511487 RepID=UPI003F8BA3A8
MKLLFIAPGAKPVSAETGGSVEISIYQIAKRLAKKYQVTVLCRSSPKLPKRSREGKLTIVRIPAQGNYVSNVIRYVKKNKFDCIHIDNRPHYIPELRKTLPETPLILSLHSLTFMDRLEESQQQEILQQTSAVVCNSQFITHYYQQRFPQHRSKLTCIYLGVDLDQFRPPQPLRKQKERARHQVENTYNILYVGRVIPMKGIHILIAAAGIVRRMHEHTRLVIVGECTPGYRKELEKEADEKGVRLTFIRKMSPKRVHRAYWLGDCLVCPTQFQEAFGLVNVEAMACGLPVIASNRGGIPEIIHSENGILIDEADSPERFANAIDLLITSPALRDELVERASITVRLAFSWDKTAHHYRLLYKQLLPPEPEPVDVA